MRLSAAQKIRIILEKRGVTLTELSKLTNQTRQNFSNKMTLDNFREKELIEIADKLNCTLEVNFILNDSKEKI